MKIRKGSKMFNFAMETLEPFLSNTFYVLCHLPQRGLRAGRIGVPTAFHELKKELLLFILCQRLILLLRQTNGSPSRVVHNCHDWRCL